LDIRVVDIQVVDIQVVDIQVVDIPADRILRAPPDKAPQGVRGQIAGENRPGTLSLGC
jgi:hypothetical protein